MKDATVRAERAGQLIAVGRIAEASAAAREALAIDRSCAAAWRQCGLAAWRLGDVAAGRDAFSHAIALEPDRLDVLAALGTLLRAQDDPGALAPLRRAARHVTGPAALLALGGCRSDADPATAMDALRGAAILAPDGVAAWRALGQADTAMRDGTSALRRIARAARLAAHDPDTHHAEARARELLQDYASALAAVGRALDVDPHHLPARLDRARLWRLVGRLDQALDEARRAIALAPELAAPLLGLAQVMIDGGDAMAGVGMAERAQRVDPRSEAAALCRLFGLRCAADVPQDLLYAAARACARIASTTPWVTASLDTRERDPSRRLRIGYLCNDLREHSNAYNLLPLLRYRDRHSFEVHAYSTTDRPDHWTDRLRGEVERWHDMAGLTDAEIARRIVDDAIDVMVFVTGSTDGNRGALRSGRLAPVQVSYLDLGATGFDAVDYWLTEDAAHPVDSTELFSEALVRLPVIMVHDVPDGSPDPTPRPAADGAPIVFGFFNAPNKLTAELLDCWGRILSAAPGARLKLKYAHRYAAPGTQARVLGALSRRSVAADRVTFESGIESRADHLRRLATVDIALDAFPYNGCTATFEALWMGVPVVTRAGDRFLARMGAAMLTHLDLDDLVAGGADSYVEIAVALAADHVRRAALRAGLRDRLRRSALCDHRGQARALEVAFREMWRRWCAGVPPTDLWVTGTGASDRPPETAPA